MIKTLVLLCVVLCLGLVVSSHNEEDKSDKRNLCQIQLDFLRLNNHEAYSWIDDSE